MLRIDRLEAVTSELSRAIESATLPPEALPAPASALVKVARIAGVDLERLAKATILGSLESLRSRASANPAAADELAGWFAHLLAWVRDERDDPPPADLPPLP